MFASKIARLAWVTIGSLSITIGALVAEAHAQTNVKISPFRDLADFEHCLKQSHDNESCLIALEKYVRTMPKDALKASKMVRLRFNAPVALRFFEMASKQNIKGLCQDDDLQLAIASGLALPKDYKDAERARGFFSGKCYAENEATLIKAVNAESGDSYLKENACPILAKHNQVPASCESLPAKKVDVRIDESLPKIDKSQIRLGTVKVYRGPEGERVTIAPIQGGDLFLIQFEGVNSGWEGKVLLHKRTDKGNDAADFWTEHDGSRWVSIVRRSGMEVHVPGYKPNTGFSVGYAEKLSRDSDPMVLLNAFQP